MQPEDRADPPQSSRSQPVRKPRQARGRERREALLDAAGAIIAESGLEALSMHLAAQRAGASVGSVYHFFRDRDQLLDALAERHHARIQPTFDEAMRRSDADWAALSPGETIENLAGWAIRYFVRHPDALATLNLHDGAKHAEFASLLDRVMRIRLGDELGPQAAATLDAVCLGTLTFTRDKDTRGGEIAIAALPDVLTAYLTLLERRQGRP